MALRRYFACDVSEQIALRRKADQEGPSLGLALGIDAQRVSQCRRSLPKFQSEFPMPPSSPRHIKHYWYHFNTVCISMHPGSQLDNLTCQLNIPLTLATAQTSHEHLPITAVFCKCLISLKSTLITTIEKPLSQIPAAQHW